VTALVASLPGAGFDGAYPAIDKGFLREATFAIDFLGF
jgi:hypothetical protein